MTKKVYIGCGAGFSGDRFDASIPIVKEFKKITAPKYLMFEVLAERTLAIAQQFRIKNPEEGYSPFLDSYITPILDDCLENNIKIISNIGAANPLGAAKRILEIAKKQNTRPPKIGVVIGDDLLEYMSSEEILSSPTVEGLDFSNNKITAANVYLGAQPIADALEKNVDIVVVGRTVDSALALGP
ncbi:MAG: acyclic terpene utilization AtuA family protein, partial [Alphaproteobacteria bacterium]|nr:acyclic terpene utilization AtuA family protein [Alphaproteobacteria bacterium]